ncbi:MAG: Eco57I restriction-modification methylase domain-containing protein [Aeromonadales bacterium]|nr:Eco57I restriction-modification methylase domain-containing protein [Aeromonadales bacterium]MDY2890670.1 Eco57I restriction-modification methylase domain-containing protein [Succinivibrio sp.]
MKLELERQALQKKIDDLKSVEERREYGQFSTPIVLAREIARQALSMLKGTEISFLEPAAGTGAFYSALLQEKKDQCIVSARGVEIDPAFVESSNRLWRTLGFHVLCSDFTRTTPDGKYNLVLTNPPYVRNHLIPQEDKASLISTVKDELGIQISGLSGLYCYYLLLAHKWLAPGALSAWLLPSEFMDVNYGTAVKKYLLDKVRLLRIHRYDPKSSQFADALVSSCVVWFVNENSNSDYEVEFTYGGTHQTPALRMTVKKSELESEGKWTRFPLKPSRCICHEDDEIGNFFSVKRGIATGDNKFFILSEDKIRKLGLDMKFFKPILPSPRKLKQDFVESDENHNPKLEKKYFLLDCEDPEDQIREQSPSLWSYIQSGMPSTSDKYLCRNRKKWYCQEQRSPTPFLCSYMGRGNDQSSPIRFICNMSNAIVTNSYLMLYPKESLLRLIKSDPRTIIRIWNILKSIKADDIEDEGRVYGGGLKKIEPRELARVHCPAFAKLCSGAMDV